MKKLILLSLVSFCISLVAKADPTTPPPLAEQNRWLYEILFAQADRDSQPNESFKSFYVHLFDSYQVFPKPEQITAANLNSPSHFEGTLGYINNIIKKRYSYDVITTADGEKIMNVRILLLDPVGDDFKNFQQKIAQAQDFWNQSITTAGLNTDFKYSFKFELVTSADQNPHYSVSVFGHTRGPYDVNWGRDWTSTTIAHEIGHMMGIADEYQTLSSKIDCMRNSLMCMSDSGVLMPHHFYFILRRLVTVN
ncbi:MAG: hypothetical protein ACXVAX_13750 [Pseudobdellovibrio sp.]